MFYKYCALNASVRKEILCFSIWQKKKKNKKRNKNTYFAILEKQIVRKFLKHYFSLKKNTNITDTCANSVDLDEKDQHELSHQDLHCLPTRLAFL